MTQFDHAVAARATLDRVAEYVARRRAGEMRFTALDALLDPWMDLPWDLPDADRIQVGEKMVALPDFEQVMAGAQEVWGEEMKLDKLCDREQFRDYWTPEGIAADLEAEDAAMKEFG